MVSRKEFSESAPGDPIERFHNASFAKRLRELRTARGWSMSDLARKLWGTQTDARGYEVARNRDRISNWESGKHVPNRQTLEQVAAVFGVDLADLAPDVLSASIKSEKVPAISMTMVEGRPETVRLVINTLASLATASKIIELLSRDPQTSSSTGQ